MAGTPVIRSGPVASISAEEFDSGTTPVDDSLTLSGSVKNGLAGAGASFLVFSTGFTSNADQFTAAGSIIAGNVLSVSMSDDTVKGPFHASAISQVVGPLTAGADSVSVYCDDGTNGCYYDLLEGLDYPGGYIQGICCPSDTPDAGSALSVTATLGHAGLYMEATVGGESMFESYATAISWCGREIQVDGGTSTPGSEIDFNSISLRDRLTTRSTTAPITGQFYGHVKAQSGIISLRGPIQLGDDGSTNNTYMLETDTFCLWEDYPVNTKFYRIDILRNSASNTTTVIWGTSGSPAGITIDVAGSTNRWALFTAGASTVEPTEFSAYNCTFKKGRAWALGSTSTIDGGVLQDILDITMHVDAEILNAQMIDVKLIYGLPPVTGQLTGSIFSSPSTYCMTIATQIADMTVDYEFDSTCRGAGKAIQFTHTSGVIHVTAAAGYYQLVAADVTVSGAGTVTFATASVTVSLSSVTHGASCKFIANETVGTITIGDVLYEAFADITGQVSFTLGYEGAFDPSGLDIIVRARQQGIGFCTAEDGGVFTDETAEGNSSTTNDMTLLPTVPVVNDAYYFGFNPPDYAGYGSYIFNEIKLDITTPLTHTGAPTFVWERYTTALGWQGVAVVTDETNGFETTGVGTIGFTHPNIWDTISIGGSEAMFWIRCRLSVAGTITQAPKARKVTFNHNHRYLPYNADRVITSTGLADNAAWVPDNVSIF